MLALNVIETMMPIWPPQHRLHIAVAKAVGTQREVARLCRQARTWWSRPRGQRSL